MVRLPGYSGANAEGYLSDAPKTCWPDAGYVSIVGTAKARSAPRKNLKCKSIYGRPAGKVWNV